MFSLSPSLRPFTFILWWCKDSGKWCKLWGDWCCFTSCKAKTKVSLRREKKERHTILIEFLVSFFRTAVFQQISWRWYVTWLSFALYLLVHNLSLFARGRSGGNKHFEVTQVDSGLVCSLYQWGPGPWALGVYLSSWGTTVHYSPPIMPHRAPFLCLNWGAVCASMNYSIYLLCCSWGLFRVTVPNTEMAHMCICLLMLTLECFLSFCVF